MELGGSDAFIVLEDADLDKSVEWAVWAKMNNTGQCCIAAKRLIVVEALADRFLAQFQAAMLLSYLVTHWTNRRRSDLCPLKQP